MSYDDESKRTRLQWWLEDLSVDPATRVAGAILIILGSILGVVTGSLHITADVGDVLTGQLDDSGGAGRCPRRCLFSPRRQYHWRRSNRRRNSDSLRRGISRD
ncbi:hypothetical protein OAJ11_02575 [Candidatus Poseidoniales archaeon]|nr:hypothetical protein [Candidatus Poseidoniales archaeon]